MTPTTSGAMEVGEEGGFTMPPANLQRFWDSHEFGNLNEKGPSGVFCSVFLKKTFSTFTNYNLCETRTRNFLTRLKPSGEMFVEEA
jgi:hypothetical protein